MANSLQIEMSNPVAGLGTFSYTMPGVAGVKEVTNITTVADDTSSLNSTYFNLYAALDSPAFYVWYNVDSAGVDPAIAGKTGVEVDISADDTANTVAAATRTALGTVDNFVITGATDHVIITNANTGATTNASNGTASPGFSYSVTTSGSTASPSNVPLTVDVQSTLPMDSGLQIEIQKNSVALVTNGGDTDNPSPTQFSIGATAYPTVDAGDVISVVLSSSNAADSQLNAVKSMVNIFRRE